MLVSNLFLLTSLQFRNNRITSSKLKYLRNFSIIMFVRISIAIIKGINGYHTRNIVNAIYNKPSNMFTRVMIMELSVGISTLLICTFYCGFVMQELVRKLIKDSLTTFKNLKLDSDTFKKKIKNNINFFVVLVIFSRLAEFIVLPHHNTLSLFFAVLGETFGYFGTFLILSTLDIRVFAIL